MRKLLKRSLYTLISVITITLYLQVFWGLDLKSLAWAAWCTYGTDCPALIGSTEWNDARTVALRWKAIPIGAVSTDGAASDGCIAPFEETLITGGPKTFVITCANTATNGKIHFEVYPQEDVVPGTMIVEMTAFSAANQSTNTLVFNWSGFCVGDGEQMQTHSTTGQQSTTITFGAQTNDIQVASSAAITLNNTCVAGDDIYVEGRWATSTTDGSERITKLRVTF